MVKRVKSEGATSQSEVAPFAISPTELPKPKNNFRQKRRCGHLFPRQLIFRGGIAIAYRKKQTTSWFKVKYGKCLPPRMPPAASTGLGHVWYHADRP